MEDYMLHDINPPLGMSNQPTGKVGNGVFMQTEGFSKDWANNLENDADKYQYVADNFKFSQMTATKPANTYAHSDDWAYINAILCTEDVLYIGTKNGGLRYTQDITNPDASFATVRIDGNASFEVHDIVINSDKKIAVAITGAVAVGTQHDNFKIVFNSSADENNSLGAMGYNIGRIKLTFAEKSPNDLFIFASAEYLLSYDKDASGIIYGIYRPHYTKIKDGTIEETTGIENLKPISSNWFNIITSSMTSMAGASLGHGMSIYVNDRDENEVVYIGGNSILMGQDHNKEGRFSFSSVTSTIYADSTGMNVGVNVHNILPMPAPKRAGAEMSIYDSIYLLATSDMGVFRYIYDTLIGGGVRWWPSSYGMNNLQTYKVAALPDGSVISATQSNAINYIPRVKDNSIRRGARIWSINNPGYDYSCNPLGNPMSRDFHAYTYSGSGVNASAIYRTTPSARKPILLSRPGLNLTRTYGNNGDFDVIDDQTWTYGSSQTQTLLSESAADNLTFAQFNTPIAFWESFDFDKTIDSVTMVLDANTLIRRNDSTITCRDGEWLLEGDSILVQSDNVGYPFFHKIVATDTIAFGTTQDANSYELYTKGSNDTLFMKKSTLRVKVPQPIQARALIATNMGAFICGKIMDFSRTIDPNAQSENKWGNLTWAKLYATGDASSRTDLATMNKRIHAVALTQDGSSAFLAIDVYSSFSQYDHTILVRIKGLNDVNIADDKLFVGNNRDRINFTTDTVATFNRQISAIVCDPKNANNMTLTFEGINSAEKNVKQTTNALATTVNFTDIALNINRSGATVGDNKPVFTALYESVNSGKATSSGRLYVGSDDGIYYRENGKWFADTENVPSVAVYNLWQQTKKLPKWVFFTYVGENAELTTYEATQNTGVIYAATYGKGILVNNDFRDTNAIQSTVSLTDIVIKNTEQTLTVYPNPVGDEANITYSLNENTNVQFRMLDINGREVSAFNCGRQGKGVHSQIVDVRNLQRGMYVIQMITDNSTKTAKIIVGK